MTIAEKTRFLGVTVATNTLRAGDIRYTKIQDHFGELCDPTRPIFATTEVVSDDRVNIHSLVNGLRVEPYEREHINLLKIRETNLKRRFDNPFVKKAIVWQKD